jgi:hypothetical protein
LSFSADPRERLQTKISQTGARNKKPATLFSPT